MNKHFVYFYGNIGNDFGNASSNEEHIKNQNQLIGFEGKVENPFLVNLGETCLTANGINGIPNGETGTLYPKDNKTIVPFRYEWFILNREDIILKHLEDVIEANEKYLKADSIGFPLMELKIATTDAYNKLGQKEGIISLEDEKIFAKKWCCFGHYYLDLIKKALYNKGYKADKKNSFNLINALYVKADGTRLEIHADAGM